MLQILLMKKTLIFFALLILVFIFLPDVIYAQTPPDPGGDPDNAAAVPIDGGLSILLAAGVGYGIKKVRDARKKTQITNSDEQDLK